ncbi:MAG: E2/UBC family protein [bacterium]
MGFFSNLLNFLNGNNQEDVPAQEANNMNRPTFSSQREDRIRNEVMMIAPRFSKNGGGIEFDEQNCDWLIINSYALPSRWKERWCKLMIIFPQGYPNVPPIGFYLSSKFRLKKGTDSHFTGKAYYGAPDLQSSGWYWYCCHLANGAWEPQVNYTKPDNLWTYLNMIRESLTNDF